MASVARSRMARSPYRTTRSVAVRIEDIARAFRRSPNRSGSRRAAAQCAEFGDEPFDLRGIGGLPIFDGENPQTNPVLAARALEQGLLVNPADAFVGKEIDFEHLERVAGAAPGIVQGRRGKFGRPALCQGGSVGETDA